MPGKKKGSKKKQSAKAKGEGGAAGNDEADGFDDKAAFRSLFADVTFEDTGQLDDLNAQYQAAGLRGEPPESTTATPLQDPATATAILTPAVISRSPKPKRVKPVCDHCGVEDGKSKCTVCQSVYYCSRDCQRRDWVSGGHKQACASLQEANAATAAEVSAMLTDASSPAALRVAGLDRLDRADPYRRCVEDHGLHATIKELFRLDVDEVGEKGRVNGLPFPPLHRRRS